jgi:hypothetical protein
VPDAPSRANAQRPASTGVASITDAEPVTRIETSPTRADVVPATTGASYERALNIDGEAFA